METTYDGIQFRSRNEAAWYAFFKAAGASPVFEPECFELKAFNGTGDKLCNYLPDFKIECEQFLGIDSGCFVEIKSTIKNESEDIAKACILGYRHPTLVIIGWPLEYAAFVISHRRKGMPGGAMVRLKVHDEKKLRLSLYQDCPLDGHIDECGFNQLSGLEEVMRHKRRPIDNSKELELASSAWNATRWNPRRGKQWTS